MLGAEKQVRRLADQARADGRPVPAPSSRWTVLPQDALPVEELLATLDVFVYADHPGAHEAFGRTLLEAAAHGVPVVATPKHRPTRTEIHIWLSKTLLYRLPVTEVPVLSGVVIAFSAQERGALLTGLFGTLVLAAVWWPGEQYFSAMRRRLQPLSADRLLDDLLSDTNGRLKLRTR